MGDLSDLRTLSAQVRREKNPNVLSYTYKDLVAMDSITIDLVPEKKGLLLKHVEYEVKSEVGQKVGLQTRLDETRYFSLPRIPFLEIWGFN